MMKQDDEEKHMLMILSAMLLHAKLSSSLISGLSAGQRVTEAVNMAKMLIDEVKASS